MKMVIQTEKQFKIFKFVTHGPLFWLFNTHYIMALCFEVVISEGNPIKEI